MNHKDAPPSQTIERIQHLLGELGVTVQESDWISNKDRFFSCRVEIGETRLGTNGKGVSREYCLASALGELVERLANQILFSMVQWRPGFETEFEFLVDPEEQRPDAKGLKNTPSEFAKAVLVDGEDPNTYWESYYEACYEATGQPPACVPFYDINGDRKVFLPYWLVLTTYGSNGMAAGNTPVEAIAEALSEIVERYVLGKILLNNVTPPTVPRQYIQEHLPLAHSLIEAIEESGRFSVTVKDGTLGVGLPAAITMLVDHERNAYFAKVGVSPDPEIALQKCLTETFQGRKLEIFMGLSPIDLSSRFKQMPDFEVYHSILTTGAGPYPKSLFLDTQKSYEFKGLPGQSPMSNREKASFLMTLIRRLRFEIYIRDVSFLGFPAYFIIVPGMSETRLNSRERLRYLFDAIGREKSISCLNRSSEAQLRTLSDRMRYPAEHNTVASKYLGIPMKRGGALYRMTVGLVRSATQYRLGDIEGAFHEMARFIEFVENHDATVDLSYYHCLRDYLWLRMELGEKTAPIRNTLLNIYKEDVVAQVTKDIELPELFDHLKLPNNWNCDGCDLRSDCQYEQIEVIQRCIKNKMKNQQPTQVGPLRDLILSLI